MAKLSGQSVGREALSLSSLSFSLYLTKSMPSPRTENFHVVRPLIKGPRLSMCLPSFFPSFPLRVQKQQLEREPLRPLLWQDLSICKTRRRRIEGPDGKKSSELHRPFARGGGFGQAKTKGHGQWVNSIFGQLPIAGNSNSNPVAYNSFKIVFFPGPRATVTVRRLCVRAHFLWPGR